jgi:hypothetical protein
MNRGGVRERAMRSALASSLAPSCQQASCQYRPSRKIMAVVSVLPQRAQCMAWTSGLSCISPSDLAAVLSLVAAHGSYVSIKLPTKPATIESTGVMPGVPGNGSCWKLGGFLGEDGSQVIQTFHLGHGCFLRLARTRSGGIAWLPYRGRSIYQGL